MFIRGYLKGEVHYTNTETDSDNIKKMRHVIEA
ncbi:hypothetical protein CJA_2595 [Cellvibrio japonicus Ueda107]|uniref:Uncharacterized protein n=1 Tax=Cellvibrio japonicus (strain Ueda107) TaxID=498211 RepID=B3PLH5_CELJU|nr:hypothetical protein CJA_2595 [Cellvibrio japonicus Ueda107]